MTRTADVLEVVNLLHKMAEVADSLRPCFEECESYTGEDGDEDTPRWEAAQTMLEHIDTVSAFDELAGEFEEANDTVVEAESCEEVPA